MENGLTPRQWALKRFLEYNFVAGRFFTIEEICENVYLPNGCRAYELNTDPRKHDKCIALSNDVREINWNVVEGYKILVKDKKGGVKLCETEIEFNEWKEKELAPIIKKYQYLNNLKWKAKRDGMVPLINNANNPNDAFTPISVFEHDDSSFNVEIK